MRGEWRLNGWDQLWDGMHALTMLWPVANKLAMDNQNWNNYRIQLLDGVASKIVNLKSSLHSCRASKTTQDIGTLSATVHAHFYTWISSARERAVWFCVLFPISWIIDLSQLLCSPLFVIIILVVYAVSIKWLWLLPCKPRYYFPSVKLQLPMCHVVSAGSPPHATNLSSLDSARNSHQRPTILHKNQMHEKKATNNLFCLIFDVVFSGSIHHRSFK